MTPAEMVITLAGAFAGIVGSVLVIGAVRFFDRGPYVSKGWLHENQKLEVRAVGTVEHELRAGDVVLIRHPDERLVEDLRRTVEAARSNA